MKLFFISSLTHDHNGTDLFAAAETHEGAFRLWCAWFSEWDKPNEVAVYELPQPIAAVAYDLTAFEQVTFKLT